MTLRASGETQGTLTLREMPGTDALDEAVRTAPTLRRVTVSEQVRVRQHPPVSPAVLRRRQVIADAAAMVTGLVIACVVLSVPQQDYTLPRTIWIATVTGLAWMMCLGMNRLYMARAVARPTEELQRIAIAGLTATGLTLLLSGLTGAGSPEGWFGVSFVAVAGTLAIERLFARWAFNRMRSTGALCRRVAIVGTDRNARELYRSVTEHPELGYEAVGHISTGDRSRHHGEARVVGYLSEIESALRALDCVGVLVSLNSVNAVQVNRLSRQLTDHGFHVALSTSLRDFDATRLRPQAIGEQTLVYIEPTIRGGWRSYAKRLFDIVLATIGVVFGALIVAIAAIAIKLDSKGPVFFRQVRVGRDGEEFEMIKLRTMVNDAEERRADLDDLNESDGPLFKVAEDPRITRVGRFLRRTSIDELPQFWNVLRGEMSVVGPRPALPDEVAEWDEQLHDRLRVLPGVTGFWQVSGRSSASFREYKRLDLYYVDNWSLLHDIKIVLKTFVVVLSRRGAS